MGNFLDEPIKDKLSEDQENEYFEVGVCSMQGWRNHMEDAHIAELDLKRGSGIHSLFGVFDGHGGDTVSKFVSYYFTQELLKRDDLDENLATALVEHFLQMDRIILCEEGCESTFKFLNKGEYEPMHYFSGHTVDSSNLKEHIASIEDKFKSRTKSDEEQEILLKIEELKTEIRELYQEGNNKEKFLNKVSQQQYLQKRAEFSPKAIGGTTSIVVYIKDNMIYCANAGDSRGVLCKEGVAEPLSYDHKPSNPEEKDRIEKAGGSVKENRVEGNLALSRAIGDFTQKEGALPAEEQMVVAVPDVKQVAIDSSCEFMIIACDGIWDCLENQQVVDQQRERILGNQQNRLSEVVEELFESILAKTKEDFGNDNMTCIIVRFKDKQIKQFMTHFQAVEEMNAILQHRQFLKYLLPCKEDFDNYDAVTRRINAAEINLDKFVYLKRWYNCMNSQSEQDKNQQLKIKHNQQTKTIQTINNTKNKNN